MGRASIVWLLFGLCTLMGPGTVHAFGAAAVVDSMRGSLEPMQSANPLPVLRLSADFARRVLEGVSPWRSAPLRTLLDGEELSSTSPLLLPLRFQPSSEPEIRPGFVPADPIGPATRMLLPPEPIDSAPRFKVVPPPRDAALSEAADGWTVQWNLRIPRANRRGVKLSLGSNPRLLEDPMAGRSAEGEIDVTPWGTFSFARPPQQRR
jgi:hypothetical protein